ncbi:MAG TPA: ABC transporter substrate-binding protein [Gammaproteobacteria bacterium]
MTDYARVLLLLLLAAAAPDALAQTFAGNEIVAGTAEELATTIATRRAELENDHEAIATLVDKLILPRFDMRRGSRAILAEHWDSASPADRDRFVTAFYDYLVATYGDLLLQFKPETLRVLPFDGDAGHSPARVHTIITLTDGTEVDVDFVMVGRDRDWLVVDIEAEGVSYVRTYRSQFRVDIAADGLGSVIEWLEQKAASVPAPGTR